MGEDIYSYEKNIIRWYPFKAVNNVLVIGDNKSIINFVHTRFNNVFVILPDTIHDNVINKYNQIHNVTLFKGMLSSFRVEKEFDYIIMLEDTLATVKSFPSPRQCFHKMETLLTSSGSVLLGINNIYSASTWNQLQTPNWENMITKEELISWLEHETRMNYRIYYPLPSIRATNIIFTEKFPPNESLIGKNINVIQDQTIRLIDDNNRFLHFINNKTENFFNIANVFLVDISKDKVSEDIRFVSFQNLRKEEYLLQTKIVNDVVYKEAISIKSKNHIERIKKNIDILNNHNIKTLDSYEENRVVSNLVHDINTFDHFLLSFLNKGNVNEFYEQCQWFFDKAFKAFKPQDTFDKETVFDKYNISCEKEHIEKMTYIKNGLYDMIFQNCFCIEKELYFFDQEWREEYVPLEFIMFRSLIYINNITKYLQFESLFNYFNITDYVPYFWQLESALQQKINSGQLYQNNETSVETIWDTYRSQKQELTNQESLLNNQKKVIDKQLQVISNLKSSNEQQAKNYNKQLVKIQEQREIIGKLIQENTRLKEKLINKVIRKFKHIYRKGNNK
jgi:hypothetical protein